MSQKVRVEDSYFPTKFSTQSVDKTRSREQLGCHRALQFTDRDTSYRLTGSNTLTRGTRSIARISRTCFSSSSSLRPPNRPCARAASSGTAKINPVAAWLANDLPKQFGAEAELDLAEDNRSHHWCRITAAA